LTDRSDRKSSRVGRSRQVGRTSRFAVELRLPAKLLGRTVNPQRIRQTERARLQAPDAAASRRPDCAGGRTPLERPRLGVGAQRRVYDVVGTNWPAAWASRTQVHVDEVPVPVTGHLNAEAKYVLLSTSHSSFKKYRKSFLFGRSYCLIVHTDYVSALVAVSTVFANCHIYITLPLHKV